MLQMNRIFFFFFAFTDLLVKVSIVVTNVRGPERQLLFEGWRGMLPLTWLISVRRFKIEIAIFAVDEMIGFVPPPNGVKLGLSIASYGGKVSERRGQRAWLIMSRGWLRWRLE